MNSTGSAGLQLHQLQISVQDKLLVAVDAQVRPGEILTVMGPSGSGKSTLLAAIAGVIDPVFVTTGDILLAGRSLRPLQPEARRVGLLLQEPLLFPHMSVEGNLVFALPAAKRGRDLRQQLVAAALEQAGLAGFADRDPATLSGGQRARVAVLRMLLAEPQAVLLDEPFAGLDPELRTSFRHFVFTTLRERGLPTLLVSHDRDDALAAGGLVVGTDGRPVGPQGFDQHE